MKNMSKGFKLFVGLLVASFIVVTAMSFLSRLDNESTFLAITPLLLLLIAGLFATALGGLFSVTQKSGQVKGPFSTREKIVGVIAVLVILFAIYYSGIFR